MPGVVIYVDSVLNAKKATVAIRDRGLLMFYYADWCGHCQHFRPAWDAFKQQVPMGGPAVAETNWDKIKLLPAAYQNIAGFPTVVYKYGNRSIEYSGDRSVGSLLAFIRDLPSPSPAAPPAPVPAKARASTKAKAVAKDATKVKESKKAKKPKTI